MIEEFVDCAQPSGPAGAPELAFNGAEFSRFLASIRLGRGVQGLSLKAGSLFGL
jgi:hypothetical protein